MFKINKMYDKGGPIVALAKFWQVLPWPLNDEDESTLKNQLACASPWC